MKKNLFLFLFFINLYHFSNQKEESNNETKMNETDFNIDCTVKNCKIENAQCKKIGEKQICNCYKCYTYNREQNLYCGYAQKRQSTALLLEVFPGFGAGFFYIGNTQHGIIKCIFFIFAMFSICLFPIFAKCCSRHCDSDCCVTCLSFLFYFFCFSIVMWYLIDLSNLGNNNYYDSSNYTLCSWNSTS